MVKESLILRSSISSQLLKSILLRGVVLAFLGMLALLLAGTFLPLPTLQTWGWGLFLVSLGLITIGLLPYRRLSRLQLKPYELLLVDPRHVAFYSKGRKILTIPLQSVAKMSYVHHPKLYGIAIWFKPSPVSPPIIHQAPEEVACLRHKSQQIDQADLFFPYFNRHAYEELMEWQDEEEQKDD